MTSLTDQPLAFARQVLEAQPFNHLIGAELTTFDEGRATLELAIEERHLQQFGLVHGGVLSYLADNVLTFACGTVLGPSVVTGGFAITYLQGAREGTLCANATVEHHNDRLAVATVEIVLRAQGAPDRLCAVAQGTVHSTAFAQMAEPLNA